MKLNHSFLSALVAVAILKNVSFVHAVEPTSWGGWAAPWVELPPWTYNLPVPDDEFVVTGEQTEIIPIGEPTDEPLFVVPTIFSPNPPTENPTFSVPFQTVVFIPDDSVSATAIEPVGIPNPNSMSPLTGTPIGPTQITLIPEPSTYALLLIGAGFLTFISRTHGRSRN